MKPPTGGPTIGPIIAGTSSQDIAETMLRRSTLRSNTSRPTGIIMAPPRALDGAGGHEQRQRGGEGAQHRAEDEDDDRGAEDGARAEPVGDLAAGRDDTARLSR